MKKVAMLLSAILLLSACQHTTELTGDDYIAKEAEIIIVDDDSQKGQGNTLIKPSYVQSLVEEKVLQLGLDQMDTKSAIQVAYDYLVENIYFADPVGLDLWRYLSEEPEVIPYLENRTLSPMLFEIGSCEDFATAMVMLLEAAQIPSKYVAGYTLSVDGVFIDHAWAVVQLDGRWYHLDPQLEQNVTKQALRYRYFMLNDEEMQPDHLWYENLMEYWRDMPEDEKLNILENYSVPKCTDTYPRPESKEIVLPLRPDMLKVEKEIQRIKSESGKENPLPPITLNVEPPILVTAYHITPPLLPPYMKAISTSRVGTLRYGRSLLTGTEAEFYDYLEGYLLAPKEGEVLTAPGALSSQRVGEIISMVLMDSPNYYWAEFEPVDEGDYRRIIFSYTYDLSAQLVAEQQASLAAKAEELLGDKGEYSDFEKALYIYDYIGTHTVYDNGIGVANSGNQYGALINNYAYCNGYARAFQFLADWVGLDTVLIYGRDNNAVSHSWNAVKMEGSWYYVDTTWGRSSNSYGGAYHDFFGMTLEESGRERIWSQSPYPYLPETDSENYNFYINKDYTVNLGNPPHAYRDIERLVDVYTRQLLEKDNLNRWFGYTFLEVKIIGDENDYLQWKNSYTKEVFNILKAMEDKAEQEGLPFSVSADTTVTCYFNDSMQILAFYPKVKQVEREV